MVTEFEKKCATGVPGFDNLCEGGLMHDSLNLIMGNPGAGKTTFLYQFLYNGVTKHNENGLFISLESDPEYLYRVAGSLGMDFRKLGNKCEFIKFNSGANLKELQKEIVRKIAENDVKRICIDPINVLSLEVPDFVSLRKHLFKFLNLLKELDACVVIAGETDEVFTESNTVLPQEISFTKYMVDGVIEIYSSGISGSGDRAVRITKMRMTNHKRGPVGMKLTSSGMVISKTRSII